jgi:hypothetical protein
MARAFMKDLLPTSHRTVDHRQTLLFDFVPMHFPEDFANVIPVAVAHARARMSILCFLSPLDTKLNLIQLVILPILITVLIVPSLPIRVVHLAGAVVRDWENLHFRTGLRTISGFDQTFPSCPVIPRCTSHYFVYLGEIDAG